MKLFIAFEAVDCLLVLDPLLLGTKGSLYYLLHLLVHSTNNISTTIIKTINTPLPHHPKDTVIKYCHGMDSGLICIIRNISIFDWDGRT